MMTKRTNREFQMQAMMIVAKVIEAPGDIHACHQGACSSHQVVQPQAKRGIEPFNESRIDDAFFILSSFDQALHHFLAALHNTSVNGQDTFNTLFDNLHNGDV
jgi:hypothetical protein